MPRQPAPPSSTSTGANADLERLLSAVREAGDLAMTYFGRATHTNLKPDGTEVSEADLAVNALLEKRLMAGTSGYGWLSEESGDNLERLRKPRVWIVDPIDGTRAFLKRRPEWTISAALVENDHPVLAAVHNPATDEFFHAARGRGAFLNGQPVSVKDPVALEGSRLAGSSTQLNRRDAGISWPPMETLWVNSIAYRLSLVAAGTCDGAVSLSGKSDWDIAAAHLIVEEAGGTVTTHDGSEFVYNLERPRHPSVVAAGPALHAALIERVSRVKL